MSETSNNSISVQSLKEWITLIVSVVACIAGVIFWVQSASDAKFERVQSQIESLKKELIVCRKLYKNFYNLTKIK